MCIFNHLKTVSKSDKNRQCPAGGGSEPQLWFLSSDQQQNKETGGQLIVLLLLNTLNWTNDPLTWSKQELWHTAQVSGTNVHGPVHCGNICEAFGLSYSLETTDQTPQQVCLFTTLTVYYTLQLAL